MGLAPPGFPTIRLAELLILNLTHLEGGTRVPKEWALSMWSLPGAPGTWRDPAGDICLVLSRKAKIQGLAPSDAHRIH